MNVALPASPQRLVHYAWISRIETLPDGSLEILFDAIREEDARTLLRDVGRARRGPALMVEHLLEHGSLFLVRLRGHAAKLRGSREGALRTWEWYRITTGGKSGVRAWRWPSDALDAVEEETRIQSVSDLPSNVRGSLREIFRIGGRPAGGGEVGPLPPPDAGPRSRSPKYVKKQKAFIRRWVEKGLLHHPLDLAFFARNFGAESMFRWVGFLNVGQGACAAIYDEDLKPYVYIDFGFPLPYYRSSAPWNLSHLRRVGDAAFQELSEADKRNPRACLCRSPLIVFSHWDYDHWYQAKLGSSALGNALIIAPSDPVGAIAKAFWDSRPDATKAVMEGNGDCLAFDWGYLVRAQGPADDPNRSGIAALVRVLDDPAVTNYPMRSTREGQRVSKPTFTPDERYVAIVGDALFGDFPCLSDPHLQLVGLAASHHGATHDGGVLNIPLPATGALPRIVYSYGLRDAGAWGQLGTAFGDAASGTATIGGLPTENQKHCYTGQRKAKHEGHPRHAAVEAYSSAGWTYRLDTAYDTGRYVPQGLAHPHNWQVQWSATHLVQGNVLIGPPLRTLQEFAAPVVEVTVCSSPHCRDNRGCGACHFQFA